MTDSATLSNHQFKGRKLTKDPNSDDRKPHFGGGDGAKTMRVDSGKGLPASQKRHRHHRKNAPRTKRADRVIRPKNVGS